MSVYLLHTHTHSRINAPFRSKILYFELLLLIKVCLIRMWLNCRGCKVNSHTLFRIRSTLQTQSRDLSRLTLPHLLAWCGLGCVSWYIKLPDIFLQSVCWNSIFKNGLKRCCDRENMVEHVQVKHWLKLNMIQRSSAILCMFLYCVHGLICSVDTNLLYSQLSENTAGSAVIILHIPISFLWNICIPSALPINIVHAFLQFGSDVTFVLLMITDISLLFWLSVCFPINYISSS